MVTFGALLAFMAVNVGALLHFWFAHKRRATENSFVDAFVPGVRRRCSASCLLLGLQTVDEIRGLDLAGGWA